MRPERRCDLHMCLESTCSSRPEPHRERMTKSRLVRHQHEFLWLLWLSSEVTFLFRPPVLVSRGRAEAMLRCLSDRVGELESQPEPTSQHLHTINILTIWAVLIRHELPANLLTLCVYVGRLGVSFLQYA